MIPQTFADKIKKYDRVVVIAAWLMTLLLYLKGFGLHTDLEAAKYIEEAERLIANGHFSAPRFWFYSVTVFIIALSMKLHIGLCGAFVIQAVINLTAYLFFYKALKLLFQGGILPLLIVLYLLFFWPYQSWHVYLFTESAFYSMILLLFSALVLANNRWLKGLLLIGGTLLLVIMARPLGILFAMGTWVYFFTAATRKQKIIIGLASVVLVLAAGLVINTILSSISDWTVIKPFSEESIICGLPATTIPPALKLAQGGSPLYQLYYYLTHNSAHFFHLAGTKLRYYYVMTRTYYSSGHNLFLLANIIPLYLLALAGICMKRKWIDRGILFFMLSMVVLYTITIVMQCDDYHNRFILSIYPFFVIMAAIPFRRMQLKSRNTDR